MILKEMELKVTVDCFSRSGELYSYPNIESSLAKSPKDGYLTGELTVILDDELFNKILPKLEAIDKKEGTNNVQEIQEAYSIHKKRNIPYILPRSIGNGLINSDDVPHENLLFEVWDYITEEDYILAKLKDKKNLPKVEYKERFDTLKEIINIINADNIKVIKHKYVRTLKEATDFTSEQMKAGLEGAILKDLSMLFKDGTSNKQLKLKIAFNIDVRVTGFVEGRKGTKRELTFGSLEFETDDGLIKGSTSGFTDKILEDFNSRRNEIINSIIEIEGNDLTKSRTNKFMAVSHPRFIELRTDKDYTDDLDRAILMLESAKEFKNSNSIYSKIPKEFWNLINLHSYIKGD